MMRALFHEHMTFAKPLDVKSDHELKRKDPREDMFTYLGKQGNDLLALTEHTHGQDSNPGQVTVNQLKKSSQLRVGVNPTKTAASCPSHSNSKAITKEFLGCQESKNASI